ncbi:DJ-1/PfpI family protein [Mycobacteroides chelonae]|nr:DJ-1/PfpI family protein [Mycobacteroides chelonae]MEC4871942.1 DJ-1/PfpI family protein [Mycobacteroides chelonae]
MGEIQRVARRSRRVAGVCAGAFLLAEADLLNGRTVTTHWAGVPCSPSDTPRPAWPRTASTSRTVRSGRPLG